METLTAELTRNLPTCRRGEGFADNLTIDAGLIRGRAVPYGRTISLYPGILEEFTPGTFKRQVGQAHRVKLCLEHGQVVGQMRELSDEDDGLYFTAKISDNPAIPEAAKMRAMIDEGLADEMSIGFQTVDNGTTALRLDSGDTKYTHTRARLLEISLVPWGAYGRDATLARARLVNMEDTLRQDRIRADREWIARYRVGR